MLDIRHDRFVKTLGSQGGMRYQAATGRVQYLQYDLILQILAFCRNITARLLPENCLRVIVNNRQLAVSVNDLTFSTLKKKS